MTNKTDKKLEKILQEEKDLAKKMEKLKQEKHRILEESHKDVLKHLSALGMYNVEQKYIIGALAYLKTALDNDNKDKLDELEHLSHNFLRSTKKGSKTKEAKNNNKENLSAKKTDKE